MGFVQSLFDENVCLNLFWGSKFDLIFSSEQQKKVLELFLSRSDTFQIYEMIKCFKFLWNYSPPSPRTKDNKLKFYL
jgi:hypothetical protein